MSSDDPITVRDWRRRPPLRLHIAQDKKPGEPSGDAVVDGGF